MSTIVDLVSFRSLFLPLTAILLFGLSSTLLFGQGKGKPGGGVGGGCTTYATPTSDNSSFGTTSGSLDGGFNFPGLVIPYSVVVSDLAVQSDGKTVLFGSASGPWDLLVARLNQDGSLDTSFGSTAPGYTLVNVMEASHFPGAGAILPSGKIVVGGWINYSGGGVYESVVAQLNSDGTLDTSFGTNGKVELYNWRNPISVDDIAVQPDGKLLLAGSENAFTVVRLLPDGSLDPLFGSGGWASAAPVSAGSGFALSTAVAVQSSGRIVLGGWSKKKSTDNESFTLAAFTPSGQLDSSFGSGGRAVAVFSEGFSQIRDIAVDASDKVVAVGMVAMACGGAPTPHLRDSPPPDRWMQHSRLTENIRKRFTAGSAHH